MGHGGGIGWITLGWVSHGGGVRGSWWGWVGHGGQRQCGSSLSVDMQLHSSFILNSRFEHL